MEQLKTCLIDSSEGEWSGKTASSVARDLGLDLGVMLTQSDIDEWDK
jgi:hypothetical protein